MMEVKNIGHILFPNYDKSYKSLLVLCILFFCYFDISNLMTLHEKNKELVLTQLVKTEVIEAAELFSNKLTEFMISKSHEVDGLSTEAKNNILNGLKVEIQQLEKDFQKEFNSQEGHNVTVGTIHSEYVHKQFSTPIDEQAKTQTEIESLKDGEKRSWMEEDMKYFVFPIYSDTGCEACHEGIPEKEKIVLGLVKVSTTLENFELINEALDQRKKNEIARAILSLIIIGLIITFLKRKAKDYEDQNHFILSVCEDIASFGYWYEDNLSNKTFHSTGFLRIFNLRARFKDFDHKKLLSYVVKDDYRKVESWLDQKGPEPIEFKITIDKIDKNLLAITKSIKKNIFTSHLYFGVIIDITERKQAEETIATILSNISHELNSPMHRIKKFTSYCLRDLPEHKDTGAMEANLMVLKKNAEILAPLIEDLLGLAASQTKKIQFLKQPYNLYDLFNEVIRENSNLTEQSHQINLIKPDSMMFANIDVNKIHQVFRNLLTNAVKYTPSKGTITVCFSKVHVGSKSHAKKMSSSKAIFIQISDEGEGVMEDELELIFEPFVRSHKHRSSAGGRGLGLTLCNVFIKGHGGKIWATINETKGLSFNIILPI